MIKRELFTTVGMLNEDYGVGGGEDTEFSIEAEKHGYKVVETGPSTHGGGLMVGQFPIFHKGGRQFYKIRFG